MSASADRHAVTGLSMDATYCTSGRATHVLGANLSAVGPQEYLKDVFSSGGFRFQPVFVAQTPLESLSPSRGDILEAAAGSRPASTGCCVSLASELD